jgi:Uma2 family endonuclease
VATLAAHKRSRAEAPVRRSPPELQNGDRLKSGEFLRRYEAMPELRKAELIEGQVLIMASPVSGSEHGKQDAIMQTWLGTYAVHTPGVDVYANSTLILDPDNTFQPDAILCFSKTPQGRSRLNAKGYIIGPVELVAEVTASSESIDLGEKFRVYARNGIAEYLVWRTRDKAFDWFVLENQSYRAQAADARGILRSRSFVGLELDVAALLRLDVPQVFAKLQRALATPAHAAFARQHR